MRALWIKIAIVAVCSQIGDGQQSQTFHVKWFPKRMTVSPENGVLSISLPPGEYVVGLAPVSTAAATVTPGIVTLSPGMLPGMRVVAKIENFPEEAVALRSGGIALTAIANPYRATLVSVQLPEGMRVNPDCRRRDEVVPPAISDHDKGWRGIADVWYRDCRIGQGPDAHRIRATYPASGNILCQMAATWSRYCSLLTTSGPGRYRKCCRKRQAAGWRCSGSISVNLDTLTKWRCSIASPSFHKPRWR